MVFTQTSEILCRRMNRLLMPFRTLIFNLVEQQKGQVRFAGGEVRITGVQVVSPEIKTMGH